MPTHLDDAALVAAAQGGDRNALDQLLRRHYERIHAVCRRVAGSARDGDDACQEALIKIVRNLPRFDGRSSFGTWAYRIATNASLDELRKRNRRPGLAAVDDQAAMDVADPVGTQAIDAIGERLLLDDALAALAEDLRAAVVLRDVANLGYGEIAEILEIPVGTVKSRISRGRAALARDLGVEAPPEASRSRSGEPTGELDGEGGNRTDVDERPTDLT